jgi:beta-lactamase class D
MKKVLLLTILFTNAAFSSNSCLIAKENGTVLQQEGDCKTAYTPESTLRYRLV